MFSRFIILIILLFATTDSIWAIEIVVDYSYDSENFFNTAEKRTAIEAAAARFSRVIDSQLTAVEPIIDLPCGDSICPSTWRVGFTHPGTGDSVELSTALSEQDDIIDVPAAAYGFPGLEADTWLLFAGGRSMQPAAVGGTGTGINFSPTFDKLDGPLHRGVIDNTPDATLDDLPAWGGTVAFNQDVNWHFAMDETLPLEEDLFDFYSIALHEIGHALGLATHWNQWSRNVRFDEYIGENAIAALNEDNDASLTSIPLISSEDTHWIDGEYQSFVFSGGVPNQVGTVDGMQDLLMEPTSNFTNEIRRFEITNVDAAALVDIGWSIVEPAAKTNDINGDGMLDARDIDLACSSQQPLDPLLEELRSPVGDFDLNGIVGFSDFLVLAGNFAQTATYSDGDLSCDGLVDFTDFLTFSRQFGASFESASVPEPNGVVTMVLIPCIAAALRRRRSPVNRS